MLGASDYSLDIVYVVDSTNAGALVEIYGGFIKKFGDRIVEYVKAKGHGLSSYRQKLVFFGDFAADADEAIVETEFFDMATQREEFERQLDEGGHKLSGGDMPENGLEALYTAIRSDFTPIKPRANGRHVIVLISDAYPLRLQERAGCFGYAAEFPQTTDELEELWDRAEQTGETTLSRTKKRLVMLIPDGNDKDGHTWENVVCWTNTACAFMTPDEFYNCDFENDERVDLLVTEVVRAN